MARRQLSNGYLRWEVRRRYNLSEADYWTIHARQEGKCAICLRSDRKLCVDHDHYRKNINGVATRGLLCYGCNVRLGWIERYLRQDEWGARAHAYLVAPPIYGRANRKRPEKRAPAPAPFIPKPQAAEPRLAAASRRLRALYKAKAPVPVHHTRSAPPPIDVVAAEAAAIGIWRAEHITAPSPVVREAILKLPWGRPDAGVAL
jgi:hypothetical protein